MISKKLVLKIFEAFSIERWTDLVRPFDLIEMDKCGEKMVLAYLIAKYEENKGIEIDWEWMIYAAIFELFRKISLCDIKSPVQRKIKTEYPEEYKRLNEWVLAQYKNILDKDLFNQFEHYITTKNDQPTLLTHTERIFAAAHRYSALRECEMLAIVNEPYRVDSILSTLYADLQPYMDLVGLQMLLSKQKIYKLLLVVEQLRFQVRWNQTPRVPKTTVLGHTFFVAVMTILMSRNAEKTNNLNFKMCKKRIYNNFFSALFHDLPEAVTRDIISPVKQATDYLPSIVKEIEDDIMNKELAPLMEPFYASEIMYFTGDEFKNRIMTVDNGVSSIQKVSFEELNTQYNSDCFSPIDGKLVRLADHIAAFVEADSSIKHGITSTQLQLGRKNLLNLYPKGKIINGFEAHQFFNSFLS